MSKNREKRQNSRKTIKISKKPENQTKISKNRQKFQ